jgi:hypothetical protein
MVLDIELTLNRFGFGKISPINSSFSVLDFQGGI